MASVFANVEVGPKIHQQLRRIVHGVQSLSGTGALRLGAEFLSNKLGRKTVYYSDPTWGKCLLQV